ISAVFFDGAQLVKKLALANGTAVEALGKVGVYEQAGYYQFYITEIRPAGIGDLHKQFEALKTKLQNEGLFDAGRKKKLALLPGIIGIISASNSAAIQDFINVTHRRNPDQHLRIIDSRMQGADAVGQIIRSIRYFNRENACDLIVITRGGGSMEDLWAFNDEKLVRQIAKSDIPVISAIGHETDFTLADYVADKRASTPSVAAEMAVPIKSDLLRQQLLCLNRLGQSLDLTAQKSSRRLEYNKQKLVDLLTDCYQTNLNRLNTYSKHYIFQQPQSLLHNHQIRLDDSSAELQEIIDEQISKNREQLQALNARLQIHNPLAQMKEKKEKIRYLSANLTRLFEQKLVLYNEKLKSSDRQLNQLNPRHVLNRGYSILFDKDGKTIKSKSQINTDDEISATIHDADLTVIVKNIRESKRHN
ncbi:MAG: exodeoxyribonuclease VII large subunit, partial [Lentisphaeria bacterium]|nr:exodeoxyribonuclease VII large subunit [Lentisphaeria bacterium]